MSKDKKPSGLPFDETIRPESVATKEANFPAMPSVPEPFKTVRAVGPPNSPEEMASSDGAPLPSRTPEPALKSPPVRKAWSTPLQVMAKIEGSMSDLDERQKAIVFAWFAATYFPSSSSTEAKP